MSTPTVSTSLSLARDSYESFHGVYDLPEYASIFGSFRTAVFDGSVLLFQSVEGMAISGPGASFGGLLINSSHVRQPKLRRLAELIEGLTAELKKQSPESRNVCIRLAPDIYYPPSFIHTFHSAFALTGWTNVGEITHVISPETYRPRKETLWNARKAERECRIAVLAPDVCFDFLSPIKLDKGYRFPYARHTFLEQFQRFSNHFRCYGVENREGNLLAASFELVNQDWALMLNWDQSQAGRLIGAIDFLLRVRLEALFSQGFRFVDTGTTTDGRKANWGLVKHKENFGGCSFIRTKYLLASKVATSDCVVG